jgi:hypothetical protein
MEYKKIIKDLNEKAVYEGLTKDDYNEIKEYLNGIITEIHSLSGNKQLISEYKDYKLEFEYMLLYLIKMGLFHKISDENIDYISNNVDLLPFVASNNSFSKIELYSSTSYRFLCQFHQEKTPSLGVTDSRNLFFCFGCGQTGNLFDYLGYAENISFIDSIYLAALVYGIDIPYINKGLNSDTVKAYRNYIISDEYRALLNRSYNRLKARNETNIYYRGKGLLDINDIYDAKFSAIERIRENKPDENFVFQKVRKRIYMERENKPDFTFASQEYNRDELPFN